MKTLFILILVLVGPTDVEHKEVGSFETLTDCQEALANLKRIETKSRFYFCAKMRKDSLYP